MRFSAPRSLSPSPVRKIKSSRKRTKTPSKVNIQTPRRHASTFGLNSDDDDDYSHQEDDSSDSYDSESGSEGSTSSSDSDSFCYGSESEVPPPPLRPRGVSKRTVKEQRYVDDTIAAIRLRARHHDPYEKWEKEMRKESLRTAKKDQESSQTKLQATHDEWWTMKMERLTLQDTKQQSEVNAFLEKFRARNEEDEAKLRQGWEARNKFLWDRVEKGIKLDQDKAQAKWDEECKIKEAEEKARREEQEKKAQEEEKRRLAEEKSKREEEEARKKKEEDERKEKEETERREKEVAERAQRLKAEDSSRKQAGITTPEEDWAAARRDLHTVKSQGTHIVKKDPSQKSTYLAGRRQIIPKVGQVTDDRESIARVSLQLVQILVPSTSHPPSVYNALLSALAKAFIMQAETEVTAEKRSVEPLAQVAFKCLDTLTGFPEVFFAKITQRVGGWVIPISGIPRRDHDGRPWKDAAEEKKVMGYREGETQSEYSDRVLGVMRLYFAVLKIKPENRPLGGMWQTTRMWTWTARMATDRFLLESPVGAGVLYVALETLGVEAKQIWGAQFVKLLSLLYDGATKDLGNGKQMGGGTPDGIASRSRVRFEIENIMNAR